MSLKLKTQRLGFDPSSIHVRFFLIEERALGQVFLRVLRFSPVSIIPPVPYIHLDLHLASMTNGRSRGTFQKSSSLPEIGDHWIENYCHIKVWKSEGLFILGVFI
jgi:hypothetical protein